MQYWTDRDTDIALSHGTVVLSARAARCLLGASKLVAISSHVPGCILLLAMNSLCKTLAAGDSVVQTRLKIAGGRGQCVLINCLCTSTAAIALCTTEFGMRADATHYCDCVVSRSVRQPPTAVYENNSSSPPKLHGQSLRVTESTRPISRRHSSVYLRIISFTVNKSNMLYCSGSYVGLSAANRWCIVVIRCISAYKQHCVLG